MAYLKLNESNEIIPTTVDDAMVDLNGVSWVVAWVNNNEIETWGCMDEGGLIDSAKFHHPELTVGNSSDLSGEETITAVTTAVNHLKSLGKKVYKDGAEQ